MLLNTKNLNLKKDSKVRKKEVLEINKSISKAKLINLKAM